MTIEPFLIRRGWTLTAREEVISVVVWWSRSWFTNATNLADLWGVLRLCFSAESDFLECVFVRWLFYIKTKKQQHPKTNLQRAVLECGNARYEVTVALSAKIYSAFPPSPSARGGAGQYAILRMNRNCCYALKQNIFPNDYARLQWKHPLNWR